MKDRENSPLISAEGRKRLQTLLGECAGEFIVAAEDAVDLYFALRETSKKRREAALSTPKQAETALSDIAGSSGRLASQLNQFTPADWSRIRERAFLRDSAAPLLSVDLLEIVVLLQDLQFAAADEAAAVGPFVRKGRQAGSEGVLFIRHLADRWSCEGKISPAKKGQFYRAVQLVCEFSQVPVSDPTGWIESYLELQN
ncbi:hypothetical protein [Thiosocius teredinicola]|uniref:hypothetical protein n=1 Tax=Thiosocius teredinicola TaxID=1973002 RepID=UPI000F7A5DA0